MILTVEEKVYDQVLECFNSRDSKSETPVHVINMNVVDNPEDATIGAFLLCELAQLLTSRFELSVTRLSSGRNHSTWTACVVKFSFFGKNPSGLFIHITWYHSNCLKSSKGAPSRGF